jgi:signal transduction histidine kinase/CheY-like chemotaxis protein
MLIFASVAALFGILGLSAVTGRLPDPVVGVALAVLLAQPLFTLRLAHQLRPLPRPVWALAILGFAITAVPLIFLPLERLTPLFVAASSVFGASHVVAAFFLAREAQRRVGSARVRLGSAAAASVCMALALGLITFGSGVPFASDAGRILALAAATLYVFAFMPPAWVRRVWGAVATFDFTDELMDAPASEGVGDVWSRAARLARRTTGAVAAVVISGDPARTLAIVQEGDATTAIDCPPLTSVPEPRADHQALASTDGQLGAMASAFGAPYASVLGFGRADGEHGALILFRERPSLFAADDHRIVSSLLDRAAVFAERSDALGEQAALAQRLAVTVQALEQASQAKSDFLASMSHELRTPLSAIIGFSALMRDEPLESERRSVPDEWVQHIHRSGDHLLALINDVLDLTKIEAGRIMLEREPFDLGSALAESIEGLRPLASRKRIEMVLDTVAGSISADRGRLRQIVYNLLSNAIKFTPEDGRISIESRWEGDEACIAVTDTGVGVAPDDLDRIFEEFSQVGDIKAREAGTGLGLALSRRLAEAHGGQITVSSEPGVGSRFELRLPGARVEQAGTAPPPEEAAASIAPSGSTVLVIEDDPGAVRLLRTYLEGENYEVVVATNGEAGIAAARSALPAAIILDVLLPGIDGWEVLRRLKADTELRDVPVVVVTVVDERNVAMSLGAVDYFLKPIRPAALLARLSQYTFTTKVKQREVRVLAIDDDPAARDLVVNALRPEGFDVVAAASGREGLALALEHPPELVICDLVMPDMDGYEVVDRLQANEATRDATILILTGQDLTTADRERLNGKVADILAKGEDPRPAFARWLRRAAAASERRSLVVPEPTAG